MDGPLHSPPRIPGVELGEELGHGAHSTVYRARIRDLPCAVKVPRTRGRWVRWVYREAVALARVRHSALPAVLEVGEASDVPYLALELVEGETLAERVALRPLGDAAAIELALTLANALAAVHDAGLVHRDVKPRNIIVERSGAVRLVDFGFAAPVELLARGSESPAGTPRYAAPEQFRSPPRVDGRTDLYALGMVLLECLGNDKSALTPGMARVIADLTADSPDARYPDARALEEDLHLLSAENAPLGASAYVATPREPLRAVRERQLGALQKLATATEKKGGSVALVRGAPGSGKSHLLASFAARLRNHGAQVVAVRCRPGDAALATAQNVLVSIASEPAGLAALRTAAAGELAAFVALCAPSLDEIQTSGSRASDLVSSPDAFAEAMAEVLVRVCRIRGAMHLVVDDLQWIDPVSRELLARFAYRVHETSSLLVFGARPEIDGSAAAELIRTLPPARMTGMELDALSLGQVGALVATHLGIVISDETLVSRVSSLADGTPLGVLQLLGGLLDVGAVRPQAGGWQFDAERVDRIELGDGSISLLQRRLSALPAASRKVMDAAAALGSTFDDAMLARLFGLSLADLDYALDDGRRNGLLERESVGRHRFVHDTLRELLISGLPPAALRALHQQIAETYDAGPCTDLHALCARADHYRQGELERAPAAVFNAAARAADAVLQRFDNEMALRYLDLQESVAAQAGLTLDATFHTRRGDAALRVGAFDASARAFAAALEIADDRLTRATLHGRIAWVHQTRGEPDCERAAQEALDRAFATLSARSPSETPVGAAIGFAALAVGELSARVSNGDGGRGRSELELLCELYYQCARLGMEYGKPLLLVQSALCARRLAARLPPCRARARAHAMVGVVATAVGRVESGAEQLATAKAMSRELHDPATHTFCLQLEGVAASLTGDFDRTMRLFQTCMDEHGHWLELNDYCLMATSLETGHWLKGRAQESQSAIFLAVERLRRNHHVPAGFSAFIVLRARATLAEAGRPLDDDPWLVSRYEAACKWAETGRGFLHMQCWGPRLRTLVAMGEVPTRLDALTSAFEREGFSPGSTHLLMSDYFVSAGHARIDAMLRAPEAERALRLPALKKAIADLRAAAKLPPLRVHALLAEGHLARLAGRERKARKLFAEAEELAHETNCSWVLSALARARAHMLKKQGRDDAARDQARIALLLAPDQGAVVRAKMIREEFQLPAADATPRSNESRSSVQSASRRAQRQLASLLNVVGAAQPGMRPSEQAEIILDNLVRDLEAERATLWFHADAATPELRLVRTRSGANASPAENGGLRDELLRRVRATGEPWPPRAESLYGVGGSVDPKRALVFPLFLYDAPVGAVCFERRGVEAPWSRDEREVIELVSLQIPVAIEICRLLSERAEMQAHLLQAQKMEAVGQLAGGVAHDFNNMLTVIKASTEAIAAIADRDHLDRITDELVIISQTTGRAARLTKELLSFSRHQPASFSEVDVNVALNELLPMLQRMVSASVRIDVRLARHLPTVHTDRAKFDQAIVNLVLNARDAMGARRDPQISITTREVVLDEDAVRRGAPRTGDYVAIDVMDTGTGMPPEVKAKVFDPFFTTKPVGSGTGLGLTTVYGFVKHSAGYISVESEVGRGTTFHIHLPPSPNAIRHVSERPSGTSLIHGLPRGDHAILVVDDDKLVRDSVIRVLTRAGYRTFAATGGTDALEIMETKKHDIALVVLDIMMPGMTGPELAQRFAERRIPAKVLFVSGFAPGALPDEARAMTRESLLQKPFENADLLRRVAQLLDHVGDA